MKGKLLITQFCVYVQSRKNAWPSVHPSERKMYFCFPFKFQGKILYFDFQSKLVHHHPSYMLYDENFSFTYTLKKANCALHSFVCTYKETLGPLKLPAAHSVTLQPSHSEL